MFFDFDLDGDGINETTGYDTDGDGRLDVYLTDLDGDGNFNIMQADTNGDGIIDTVAYDYNGDGIIDAAVPAGPPADPHPYVPAPTIVGGNSGPGYTIIDPNTGQDITDSVHSGSMIVGGSNPGPGQAYLNDHNSALNGIWLS
ncbi:hypothetical protein GOHSU_40_00130 [Gordonia hirsuta DSM 44140 = NBRC 16056]|uniref:Uncharacterized protein n=1 Tax=Gordonia hirsuta DSM 44140 = NBRC 16056 TaxID=1121927 RepID=L7LBY0_9ACTN|nr:hypothetical protein [Gordonia hirsuta]GAC58429.1 hypothetical protein GOHSU_40_00130 [Gordonia hirsuta DSM 44140 = NBRC 16056]